MLKKFFGGSFVAELKPAEMFCTDRMRKLRFLWSSYVDESQPKKKIEQHMNAVIFSKSNAHFFVEAHFCLCVYSVMKKSEGLCFGNGCGRSVCLGWEEFANTLRSKGCCGG